MPELESRVRRSRLASRACVTRRARSRAAPPRLDLARRDLRRTCRSLRAGFPSSLLLLLALAPLLPASACELLPRYFPRLLLRLDGILTSTEASPAGGGARTLPASSSPVLASSRCSSLLPSLSFLPFTLAVTKLHSAPHTLTLPPNTPTHTVRPQVPLLCSEPRLTSPAPSRLLCSPQWPPPPPDPPPSPSPTRSATRESTVRQRERLPCLRLPSPRGSPSPSRNHSLGLPSQRLVCRQQGQRDRLRLVQGGQQGAFPAFC